MSSNVEIDDSYRDMLRELRYDPARHSLEDMAGNFLTWYGNNAPKYDGSDRRLKFLIEGLGVLSQLCCMMVIEIQELKKKDVDTSLRVWMPPHARDIWEKRRSG